MGLTSPGGHPAYHDREPHRPPTMEEPGAVPGDFDRSIERELGTPGLTWSGFLEQWEETPELRWPSSTRIHDVMRRTDAKTGAILRAYTLPILRANARLATDEEAGETIPAATRAYVENQLGIAPRTQARRRRQRQGIRWHETLRHALLYLPMGHMFFEPVYEIDGPPPGMTGLPPLMAHLRKLGPRLPRSITRFHIARDGGLDGISQLVPVDIPGGGTTIEERMLPIDRLVAFVNEREGADWAGTSILRSSYKHWLLKDKLLRIGAMAAERNGMGLPVIHRPSNSSRRQAQDIVRNIRAGETAGVDLEEGWELALLGVEGALVDVLPQVKYHEQAAGVGTLTMFLDLGHDAGARSLGDTFVDYFLMALAAVADEVAEIVTEHVIRDLVSLNFGDDHPYPPLIIDGLTSSPDLAAEGLAILVKNGVITPDLTLEAHTRQRYDLPELPEGYMRPAKPSATVTADDGDPDASDEAIAAAAATHRLLAVNGPELAEQEARLRAMLRMVELRRAASLARTE